MTNENGGLVKPVDMKYVPKSWGWELWICNNEKYCGKKIFIKQDHYVSYHKHGVKSEHLFVESGSIIMHHDLEGCVVAVEMLIGDAFEVKPGVNHQMYAKFDTVLFEFSTQHFDEDSFRTTRDLVIPQKVINREK